MFCHLPTDPAVAVAVGLPPVAVAVAGTVVLVGVAVAGTVVLVGVLVGGTVVLVAVGTADVAVGVLGVLPLSVARWAWKPWPKPVGVPVYDEISAGSDVQLATFHAQAR
jgi:hypothetical protein